MARKQTPAPSFAPLTIKIANAIKATAESLGIDFAVECVPAAVEMTDYDQVYLDSEGCRIVVAVGTDEIPCKVKAYGYILEAPGVVCREKMKLKGLLELDYSKPEAKVNGDLYVDMLDKAIKIKRTIEAALDEEIA